MAKKKIDSYIFQPGIPVSENRFPYAYKLITDNVEFIIDELSSWLTAQVAANTGNPGSIWYNYTYNDVLCRRDTRYNLQGTDGKTGVLWDLRYGGNFQARYLASKYWINSTPQINGDRAPEIAAKNFVVSLINNYILPQVAYTSLQAVPVTTTQTYDNGSSYESGTDGRITALMGIITTVIAGGLDVIPTLQRSKISSVKLQTRVPANDLLLITDSTNNEILYNFSDPDLGASVAFQTDDTSQLTRGVEEDFPKFLERTGTVTTVYLKKDTDNRVYSPKAVALLEANLEFVKKETVAWIAGRVLASTRFTPTAATFTPSSGKLVLTIPSHTYYRGDYIRIATGGLTFTCAKDAHATEHAYPRASGVPNDTGNDPSYNSPILILSSDINTITVNIGISSDTSDHLFVSATANAISDVWYNYTYNTAKCERDMGLNIIGITNDVKYSGNTMTHYNAGKYWVQTTPQIDGDRMPEILAKAFARDLINGYIFSNTSYTTLQPVDGRILQNVILPISELNVSQRVTELFSIITTVIRNGLTALPVIEEVKQFYDTDDVQIFIDQGDVITRPHDFGTDAIERMRVSNSVSMLDADFEYGLQPTKWQAIAMQRGYPSIYEVPGTDTQVSTVVTDASVGTDGIGQSLITVTTVGPHGIEPGTPITIKALENSVAGASRAEGSFVVSTVPTNSTFTFFAKSKVGTTNGEILSTYYTQLRQAGFYTGAAIGQPQFSILSQGAAGTWINPLAAETGASIVTWSGTAPEVGAPIINENGQVATVGTYAALDATRLAGTYTVSTGNSNSIAADLIPGTYTIVVDGTGAATVTAILNPGRNNAAGDIITISDSALGNAGAVDWTFVVATTINGTGIGSGAQVTSITGGGVGFENGGILRTLDVAGDFPIASNAIDVVDATGIAIGEAINRGDGTAIHISNIVGNTVNFDNNTTAAIVGNTVTYSAITGTNYESAGSGATFDIERGNPTLGAYTTVLNTAGLNFEAEDVLVIDGQTLGGASNTNDLRITVDTVDASGAVLTFTAVGSAFDGNAVLSNQTAVNANGLGTGLILDVTSSGGTLTATIAAPSYTDLAPEAGSGGTGATWDVVLTNNIYNPVTLNAGSTDAGYSVGGVVRIPGNVFGGASPTNDLDISIDGVDGAGAITSFTTSGAGGDSLGNFAGPAFTTTSIGTGAEVNINFTGTTYTVNPANPGSGYSQSDTLVVGGDLLGGTSPANDCTVTIDSVGASGVITGVSATGVAVNSSEFANIASGYNVEGTGATFNVTQNANATYTVTIGSTIGQDYASGGTLTILGVNVGGQSPTHDITINITGVDAAGSITGISHTGTAASPTQDYAVGDRMEINGSSFASGISPTNDAFIEVTGVTTGVITSFTIAGTGPSANVTYPSPAYTYPSGTGASADFNITKTGAVYTSNISNAGSGYLAGETFVIAGNVLGGATPANDATITVATIDVGGEILTITISGTGNDEVVFTGLKQSEGTIVQLVGSTATFDVTISGGTYSAVPNTPGTGYFEDQVLKIQGTQLGGTSPANDLTMTITATDGSGARPEEGSISTVSVAGTGPSGTGAYSQIGATPLSNTGSSAEFSVQRTGGSYSTPTMSNDGINYQIGNKIKILGTNLGGATTANDAVITITEVTTDGSIADLTVVGTAVAGDTTVTYATVTMSEALTGAIPSPTLIAFAALATTEVNFASAHGLIPGDAFIVTVSSDTGSNNHTLLEGPFFAQQVPTTTSLRYQCRAPGTITEVGDISAVLYPRPDSFFVHRPYDGGVMLGTGGPQHGAQAIRQSKKYIRYQSGKGIMYTTGALFAPSYDLLNVTADDLIAGSFISVTTDDVDHGLQVGGEIRLIGIETPGYNGNYVVASIVSERTFKVISQIAVGSLTPILSTRAQVSLLYWHGATVRSGAFDDQNGIFMEYDGSNFSAVQRTATLQLAGTIAINVDSNTCTGSGTRFRDQLKAGDRIVVKGMTHVVSQVTTDTAMTVTPDFRGVTNATGAKLCLISDKKTKQIDFNKDTLDGDGSSGYIMDISKMQMIGIQYSWYGAGFIDYMLRGDDGNFIFYHRMRNSNINTEAFMRTGNMPVRYEVTNEGPNDRLAADMDSSQTTIPLITAAFFPTTGTVIIDNEMISYTGVTGDTLTGCTRSSPLTNFAAGATRTYTAGSAIQHTERTGVILISNTITPIISHWGSAFLTDGGFDEDRGYIFSYTSAGNEISTTRNSVFMLRLAPSVSNAIVGDLGERELLNRAQLLLEGIEITSDGYDSSNNPITGGIVVEGILNPQNYPLNPSDVGWSGLSGAAQGGQPSFAQVAPGGSVVWSTGATQIIRSATVQATMTQSAEFLYGNRNSRYQYLTQSQWESLNDEVTTGTYVTQSGTTSYTLGDRIIDQVYMEPWYSRVRIRLNQNIVVQSSDPTVTFSVGGAQSNSNTLKFTQASWAATGAIAGDLVEDSKFSAGTAVAGVSEKTFGVTTYYEVTFTQSSNTTINPGDTVGFLFGQPPYAQPGETVFSFIATPGQSSSLSLESLKELTNTTLGGRGTYPNGPDVLAINVYKTGGTDTTANIILRWGEAQA